MALGPEIIACPPRRIAEALQLVLADVPAEQRRIIAGRLLNVEDRSDLEHEPLFVAQRGQELRGAAWGQRQSGNIAFFWPPQLVAGESESTARTLAEAVVERLDETAVEMTQALLSTSDQSSVPTLLAVGFRHLADLWYLTCDVGICPKKDPTSALEFEPYRGNQRRRLIALIEHTYEDTLDCTALDGMRTMEEVVTGYQGTGLFRPENWFFVRSGNDDVGVLLLTEHPQSRHWELIYMGLVPEFRGRGWGLALAEHAKRHAARNGSERLVLAVDAKNRPALRLYEIAGFSRWDRRAVYARFPTCGQP